MPFIHQEDGEKAIIKDPNKGSGKKRIHLDELECDVSVEDDNRQEWTFTLYDFDNSGKVTKEDMSSLMHTIYEVVDASVNQSSNNSKTLRVKLTVTPEPCSKKKDVPLAGQDTTCRPVCNVVFSTRAERAAAVLSSISRTEILTSACC
ncbi:UNVERIFIED_CONTAM: hypothetical protein FKN15_061058 [Acipenser sinensis]